MRSESKKRPSNKIAKSVRKLVLEDAQRVRTMAEFTSMSLIDKNS